MECAVRWFAYDTRIPAAEPFHTACTAVVTELAFHNKPTIDADVSFLSEAEWREELAILLTDLVDEDGNLKRSTDLKSDAGVAWQKVLYLWDSRRRFIDVLLGTCGISFDLARTACNHDR